MTKYSVIDKIEYAERIANGIIDHCQRFNRHIELPNHDPSALYCAALKMVTLAIDDMVQSNMTWAAPKDYADSTDPLLTELCPWYRPNVQNLDDLIEMGFKQYCISVNRVAPLSEFLETPEYAGILANYNNDPLTDDLEDVVKYGVLSDLNGLIGELLPRGDVLYTIRDMPDFCVIVNEGPMSEVKKSLDYVNAFNWRMTGFELSPNLLLNEVIKPENYGMRRWFGQAIATAAQLSEELKTEESQDVSTIDQYIEDNRSNRCGALDSDFARVVRQIERYNR